jgi:hypothetical protein
MRDPGSNGDAETPSCNAGCLPPKIYVAHVIDAMFDAVISPELKLEFSNQDLQTAVGQFVRHAGISK